MNSNQIKKAKSHWHIAGAFLLAWVVFLVTDAAFDFPLGGFVIARFGWEIHLSAAAFFSLQFFGFYGYFLGQYGAVSGKKLALW